MIFNIYDINIKKQIFQIIIIILILILPGYENWKHDLTFVTKLKYCCIELTCKTDNW